MEKMMNTKTEGNTFTKKIGQTVYVVRYHFNEDAKETMQEKITVLFRPSMLSLLSIPRVWDTSQQAIFNRRAAAQEGENTEVGTRFLCLL